MTALIDVLFGCWHSNYSFPITAPPKRRLHSAAQTTGVYVVCLECGKEFPYCWKTMRVLSPSDVLQYAHGSGDPQSNERSTRESHQPLLLQEGEEHDHPSGQAPRLSFDLSMGGLRLLIRRARGLV